MKVEERFLRLRLFCFRSVLLANALALALFVAAPFAGAQSTGGRIRGTVTDPSGGAGGAAPGRMLTTGHPPPPGVQCGAHGPNIFFLGPPCRFQIRATPPWFK